MPVATVVDFEKALLGGTSPTSTSSEATVEGAPRASDGVKEPLKEYVEVVHPRHGKAAIKKEDYTAALTRGWTPASEEDTEALREASIERSKDIAGKYKASKEISPYAETVGPATSAIIGAAQAPTLGHTDELIGLFSPRAAQALREAEEYANKEYFWQGLGGGLVGGALLPSGAASLLGKASKVPGVVGKTATAISAAASTPAGRAASLIGTGALAGEGYTQPEASTSDTVANMLTGGLFAGGVGTLANAAGKYLSSGWRANRVSNLNSWITGEGKKDAVELAEKISGKKNLSDTDARLVIIGKILKDYDSPGITPDVSNIRSAIEKNKNEIGTKIEKELVQALNPENPTAIHPNAKISMLLEHDLAAKKAALTSPQVISRDAPDIPETYKELNDISYKIRSKEESFYAESQAKILDMVRVIRNKVKRAYVEANTPHELVDKLWKTRQDLDAAHRKDLRSFAASGFNPHDFDMKYKLARAALTRDMLHYHNIIVDAAANPGKYSATIVVEKSFIPKERELQKASDAAVNIFKQHVQQVQAAKDAFEQATKTYRGPTDHATMYQAMKPYITAVEKAADAAKNAGKSAVSAKNAESAWRLSVKDPAVNTAKALDERYITPDVRITSRANTALGELAKHNKAYGEVNDLIDSLVPYAGTPVLEGSQNVNVPWSGRVVDWGSRLFKGSKVGSPQELGALQLRGKHSRDVSGLGDKLRYLERNAPYLIPELGGKMLAAEQRKPAAAKSKD